VNFFSRQNVKYNNRAYCAKKKKSKKTRNRVDPALVLLQACGPSSIFFALSTGQMENKSDPAEQQQKK